MKEFNLKLNVCSRLGLQLLLATIATTVSAQGLEFSPLRSFGQGNVNAAYSITRDDSIVCRKTPSDSLLAANGVINRHTIGSASTKTGENEDKCTHRTGEASAESYAEASISGTIAPTSLARADGSAFIGSAANLKVEGKKEDSHTTNYAVDTKAQAKMLTSGRFDTGRKPALVRSHLRFTAGGDEIAVPRWGAYIKCTMGENEITAVFMGTYWIVFGDIWKEFHDILKREHIFEVINDTQLEVEYDVAQTVAPGIIVGEVEIGSAGGEDGGKATLDAGAIGSDQDYSSDWEFNGSIGSSLVNNPKPNL